MTVLHVNTANRKLTSQTGSASVGLRLLSMAPVLQWQASLALRSRAMSTLVALPIDVSVAHNTTSTYTD